MLHDDIDPTLIRYFSGQLPPEDLAVFERWLAEDPARGEEVERLRAIWEASAEVRAEPDTEAALGSLKERAKARRPGAPPLVECPVLRLEPSRTEASRFGTYALRIAAAVVLTAGAGLLWRAAARRTTEIAASARTRTYVTARGERATLTLPDGSTVMLNNESTLEVSARFGDRLRDVTLRGEAYFVVAHDATRPFRVYGGPALTQVLGTRFVVRARPGEDSAQVAVEEGRVAVSEASGQRASGAVLTKGDLGVVGATGRVAVHTGVDVTRYLGWTAGRLTFDATPLPTVLAELGRWYDRDFVLADTALAKLRLTTSLRGGSVQEAIQVLEASLEVRCLVDGQRIVLQRR